MSGNWLNNIKYVNPGEPVQAGVVNRPDQTLAARTDYLKDRLDAAAVGQALFDSDATIAPSVLPGQPVFWNYATYRYEAALAAVAVDPETQSLAIQPSSDCVGICLQKKSETLGDIVLRGIVSIPELANAIAEPIAPGRYYLSGVEPGKLVKQRPGVSVGVCYVQGPRDNCSDVPRVIVMPSPRDFISEHTHYRFELVARPAGTGLSTTQRSGRTHAQIVNENPNLPGWLPASNAIFNGKAPTGAAFGYNINKHPALANVWPPLPIQSVAVLWDRAEYNYGAGEVPLGPTGLVTCDTNGIWWMSSCFGETPWPENINPNVPAAPFDPTACPLDERMRISVVFLRMLLGNDRSVVTSIVPGPDSPITILNCDDQPASTGDLALNLNLQLVTAEAIGGEAIKEIVAGKKLKAGWVAEGAFTTSNQIRITGTRGVKRNLTVAELEDLNMPTTAVVPLQQGILKIDYTDALVEREVAPQIIRLSDTVERLYMDIPYLGFPAGQGSLLRIRLNVADSNMGDNLRMKIRVRLFGRGGTPTQASTLPALYMSYRRLPKPAAGGSPLPTTDTTLSFNSALALRLDTVAQVDSAEFQIAEGDTVLVTLGRAENAADVYAEVGVLRISGIVYSAT